MRFERESYRRFSFKMNAMNRPDSRNIKLLYGYVVLLAIAGVVIHVLGFLQLGIGDAPVVSHVVMTVLDSVLLFAVLFRGKPSFYFIVVFLGYGVISQIYWTIEAILKKYDQPLLQALMASLITIAFYIVISQRRFFLRESRIFESRANSNKALIF